MSVEQRTVTKDFFVAVREFLVANGWRVRDSSVIEDRDPGDEDVPPSRWVAKARPRKPIELGEGTVWPWDSNKGPVPQ